MQLVGIAVMSRILTPRDFGLVSMVSAVTACLTMFSGLGLSAATIQRQDVDHRQMSTLFWVNTALGAGMALMTAGIAPVVAWFYHDPRLIRITIAVGSGYLIAGPGVQHQALLKRQMRFAAVTLIDAGACCVATVVGILLAWSGLGYWSLVLMQLAATLAGTVAAWMACGWRPGLPARRAGIRSMVVFGGNLTIFTFLNYIIRNCDNILIGWRWGPEALGFYSRAYQLLLLPIAQIVGPAGNVATPSLSRLQNDPIRYRNYYIRALKVIAYVTMPAIVFAGIFSGEIVAVVLGPQWHMTSTIFSILAISAVLQPVLSTVGWVYLSLDRTKTMALWGVISCPVMIAAFVIGLPWGPIGVAIGYVTAEVLLTYPAFKIAIGPSPVRMKDISDAIGGPLRVVLPLGLMMLICRTISTAMGLGTPGVLLWGAFVGSVSMVVTAKVWSNVRADLSEIVDSVKLVWAA